MKRTDPLIHGAHECASNGNLIRIADERDQGGGVTILAADPGAIRGWLVIGLEDLQTALDAACISPLTTPTGKHPRHGQVEPYEADQIEAMPCFRCGHPAKFQWSICADANVQRPICADCDILLNHHVLAWAGDPDAADKITRYAHFVRGTQPQTDTPENDD